jgi:hypothetical protein
MASVAAMRALRRAFRDGEGAALAALVCGPEMAGPVEAAVASAPPPGFTAAPLRPLLVATSASCQWTLGPLSPFRSNARCTHSTVWFATATGEKKVGRGE